MRKHYYQFVPANHADQNSKSLGDMTVSVHDWTEENSTNNVTGDLIGWETSQGNEGTNEGEVL